MKIFIASSNDLAEERKNLELLLHREKNYEPVVWENIDHSITKEKFQDRINNEHLTTSDLVVFMIKSKLGEYTIEEFKEAYENLGKNIKKMYIYFFYIDKNAVDKKELRKILSLQEILEDEGDLYQEVKNFTELENHFFKQIRYINSSNNEEQKSELIEVELEISTLKRKKVCIFLASPLNNHFEYNIGHISNVLKNYDIEIFYKVLNEDELIDSLQYEYNFIFTQTNNEKIIIEDEYFLQKSISLNELNELTDVSKTILFLNNDIQKSGFKINVLDCASKLKKVFTSFIYKECRAPPTPLT